ncbi:TD and POZ domain-containing protein 5 [Amyelois transitella]|uniref:TD and POZ domain-containing protein 5 n=1 Tax=Amyelois transitella TaxID=680683 RepID=UPI00067AA69D|nr:TD and POZ domain-containing protein 5 [Amyelois transitella]
MSEETSISSPSVITPEHPSVVYSYKTTQTNNARWLYLEDIYQKFYRPYIYDLGGTYIEDVADYWFQYKTDLISGVFLLHIFVLNRNDGPFSVAITTTNVMEFEKKSSCVFLQSSLKEFKFPKVKELKQNYLATFSFKEIDVELLKGKQFYIPITFIVNELDDELVERVKSKHDFGYLLKEPLCSDFTIEASDGYKFQVHQALLAESSEVFKAMFKDETAESQRRYLKLSDVSKEDLQCVLEFIYTGTIAEVENCNIFNILQLADQFNLGGLHDLCQYVLTQHLSTDNALETLQYADFYNAGFLKKATLKMIRNNKDIIKSSMFKELKSVELARELCEYLAL